MMMTVSILRETIPLSGTARSTGVEAAASENDLEPTDSTPSTVTHEGEDMSLMTIAHHSSVDLNWQSLLSTIVYAVLGVVLLMVFALLVNRIFRLDLRRELIEDQNIGLGVAFAGTALAIAIIIAATILS